MLIHLGDIYYSGTQREVQERFLAICRATPGLAIPIYTLAGNHDMYAGGGGYYWLLDQLQQPASYFCLHNDAWQILAMDTGLHDSDPGSVVSNVTALDPQEAVWQRDKLRHAGGRRTVLLSHHQLLSAVDGVGMTSGGQVLAVNPHLYAVFSDLLDDVAWWLWGHEHNLISFAPYMGLMRGRCIGSAAVPKLVDEQPYTPNPALVVPSGQREAPQMDPQVALGTDGRFYRHAYAVLTLQGRAATMTYYEMTAAGSRILFTEGVAA